jgi:hypothetical protein
MLYTDHAVVLIWAPKLVARSLDSEDLVYA